MENENLKPVEKLTPFTKMIMTIGTLPTSFYASMSYYESMVWLYEYLKNTVIPTVNNNAEAVEELQTAFVELKEWTETYTEETIPEEVSNKLDEMAEDGTITSLIMEYMNQNAQIVFNSIQEMKDATNITEGAFIKTYGYYNYNDGGGALYKARTETTEDVIDNMFIIALHDNTLVAELIIEDMLNIKQIGAYGDGTHDDTNTIQSAINKIHDNAIEYGRLNKNTIIIPGGKYKTTATLNLSNLIKIKTTGLAQIIYSGNGTCINISADETVDPSDGLIAQEWLDGHLISGQGLIISNANNSRGSTIGLELGRTTPTNVSYNKMYRYVIENLRIKEFHIGVLVNSNEHFGLTMEHSFIWQCDIDVNMGNLNGNYLNAGEKMAFFDCIFSNSPIAFNWTAPYMDLQLYNCSVDMNKSLFVDSTTDADGIIRVETFGGHFENIYNDLSDPNWDDYSGFVCGSFKNGAVIMNTPRIVLTYDNRLITDTNIDWTCLIVLNNPLINTSGSLGYDDTTYEHTFFSTARITVNGVRPNGYQPAFENGNIDYYFLPACDNISTFYGNKFENTETGAITIATGETVGSFTMPWFSHISTSASISNDSPIGGKVLNVTRDDVSAFFRLQTPKIPVIPGKWYYANSLTKNISSVQIEFKYYDENDTLLKTYNKGHYEKIDKDENFGNWYISPYSKFTQAPNGAKYCTVMYEMRTVESFTSDNITFSIGGIFVHEA